VAEITCDEPVTPPFSVPLCCLGGGDRETGCEVEPGNKGGVEAEGFSIFFLFLIFLL